jgi:hypothetical protein
MKRAPWIVLAVAVIANSAVSANNPTATVYNLQVHLPTNMAYVQLAGSPTFDGGGCTAAWAVGSLDDDKFMIYIWPALMSAKNQGKSVTVNVTGCLGGYPKITWIQLNPT